MRIGYVVPGGVDRSGTERIIPHLVERLGWLAARHDVRVVALRQEPRPCRWTLRGADVHNVGPRPRRLRALALLRRLHRAAPFDVLHGFFTVPQGVLVTTFGRLAGVPAVVEAPGGDFADHGDIDFGAWRRAPGRAWVRLAAAGSALVVPSEAGQALARRRGFAAAVIPLEVDGEAWPRRTIAAEEGAPRVVWVGSLNRVKDPWTLLDVAEQLRAGRPGIRIDVAGVDTLGGAVHRAVVARGLEGCVHLHGFLPQGALRDLIDRARILLVTSRWEGAGRVVLEAAARGVPAVGFPVGMVSDWAGSAAVAVPREEGAAGLAEAVHRLVGDPAAREALAVAAQARLAAHALDTVGRRWEDLYAGLAGKPADG